MVDHHHQWRRSVDFFFDTCALLFSYSQPDLVAVPKHPAAAAVATESGGGGGGATPQQLQEPVADQSALAAAAAQSIPTRQYLDQTVVPILLQALSALAKER